MDGLLQPPAKKSAPKVSDTVFHLWITAKPSGVKSPQSTTGDSNEHSTIKLRKDWLRKGDHFSLKASMKLVGVDGGPLRYPIRDMSEAGLKTVREDFERAGILEYLKSGK